MTFEAKQCYDMVNCARQQCFEALPVESKLLTLRETEDEVLESSVHHGVI